MSNSVASLRSLENQFFVMRHGNSLANQAGLVVSDPIKGVAEYGLSDLGVEQVMHTIMGNSDLNARTQIITSDFKRARQTAELVHRHLKCQNPVKLESRLRERYFGNYDGKADTCYENVWAEDHLNSDNTNNKVESPNHVMDRATGLVLELDRQHTNATILLVAHGDILQILLAAVSSLPAGKHRSITHLDTAQVRQLKPDG